MNSHHNSSALLDAPPDAPLLEWHLPSLPMTVREVQASDVRPLEWHGGVDLRSWYEAVYQAHLSGEVTMIVAALNDFPIGQAVVCWKGKPTHRHIPDIQSLRVFAAFRGLGIGSKILEAAEAVVAAKGHPQVSLACGVENPRACQLYERLGYQFVGDVYTDEWQITDAQGQPVRFEEQVRDLVKELR